jgi:NDP-sugar pyrophosphorylase family protein
MQLKQKVIGINFLRIDAADLIAHLRSLPAEQQDEHMGSKRFKRHKNRDKTPGGFVASTAKATEFVTISADSVVLDNAAVREVARLENSVVMDNANVFECARLQNIIVGGNTTVSSDIHNNTVAFENGASTVLFNGNSFGIRNPQSDQLKLE